MPDYNLPVCLGATSAGPYRFRNVQPYLFSADTADFRDFGDRVLLGKLGIFSIDRRRSTWSSSAV